jgi:hypothetical protein
MVVPAAAALEVQDLYGKLADGCWACDMLERTGAVGFDLAQQLFEGLARQLSSVLAMVMAIWLLFLAGESFLPFGPPSHLWNRGARKLAAFAAILGFLQSGTLFWDYLFMPMFSLGIGFSVQLLSISSLQSCSVNGAGAGIDGAKAALASMRCPLSLIQDVFTRGTLTGVAMIQGASWQSWMDFVKVWTWPAHLLQMLSGVLLALIYSFGFVMFPLFFIDTVLRGVMIAVLAPLAAVLALYASTRRMMKRALWELAQSALTMVFASVAAGLATQSVTFLYASLRAADGSPLSDWPALIGALEAGTLKLSVTDQPYWAILAIGVIAIFMVRSAARMAAALTGVPSGNFSGATAGVAAMAATGLWATTAVARRMGQQLQESVTVSVVGAAPLARKVTRPVRQAVSRTAGTIVKRRKR